MKLDLSPFKGPVHTEVRMPLFLPCKLLFTEYEMSAETFNVSYSGVGVKLPPDYKEIAWSTLRSVFVQDIGDFDVIVRWKRWDRLGLKFRGKAAARPVLNAYFKQTGKYPV